MYGSAGVEERGEEAIEAGSGVGQPRSPGGGMGSQTCDGSFAERTPLVSQGGGPRTRVRAKLGAREKFKYPAPGQSPWTD